MDSRVTGGRWARPRCAHPYDCRQPASAGLERDPTRGRITRSSDCDRSYALKQQVLLPIKKEVRGEFRGSCRSVSMLNWFIGSEAREMRLRPLSSRTNTPAAPSETFAPARPRNRNQRSRKTVAYGLAPFPQGQTPRPLGVRLIP